MSAHRHAIDAAGADIDRQCPDRLNAIDTEENPALLAKASELGEVGAKPTLPIDGADGEHAGPGIDQPTDVVDPESRPWPVEKTSFDAEAAQPPPRVHIGGIFIRDPNDVVTFTPFQAPGNERKTFGRIAHEGDFRVSAPINCAKLQRARSTRRSHST